jgi:hypothetical protein
LELELQIDAPNPPEHGLARPPDGLGPSEVNFVALADALARLVAAIIECVTLRRFARYFGDFGDLPFDGGGGNLLIIRVFFRVRITGDVQFSKKSQPMPVFATCATAIALPRARWPG